MSVSVGPPTVLPDLTTEDVQRQLDENAKLLEEWTKLLDKTGQQQTKLRELIFLDSR